MWNRTKKGNAFFSIFSLEKIFFFFWIWNLHKKCVLWGTSCWGSSKIKNEGGRFISYICSLWTPLQLSWFLSYLNMMYLKITDFSCRILILKKTFWFIIKKWKILNFLFSSISHCTLVKGYPKNQPLFSAFFVLKG